MRPTLGRAMGYSSCTKSPVPKGTESRSNKRYQNEVTEQHDRTQKDADELELATDQVQVDFVTGGAAFWIVGTHTVSS